MQINNLGFAGLLGAGSANTAAAATGNSLGQAFGLLLGAPNNPAGAGMTPPLAANDTATPGTATPNLSMAQLLTTAAPLTAPATPAVPATPAALDAPAIAAPDAKPVVTDIATGELPLPSEEAVLVAPQAPAKPAAPTKPNQPGKPAEGAEPEAGLDLLADAAPQPPAAEAPVEQPAETPAPVKRGPRIAKDCGEDLPADPAAVNTDAQPVVAELVQVAAVQAPVRPELAAKPQPSPARQIGEVTGGARKADAVRAEPATAQPAASSDTSDAAVSAIAGKAGDAGDNARGDDRGQAPAFTLRQDAHAAPTHAATETGRTQAAVAPAAAEPVVAARPGHLGQQMGVEIARNVEAGEDTLRVRLSPDTLGKVEVTLSFDNGGKLHATVRAESAHALDLLRQDMPDLGRALDQAGIRADAGSFRFESRSDGGGAQAQQQNQNSSGGTQLAGNDEPDMTETAYREIRGDGQVDLLA
jgi:flagellar hook-length control protein FliK